LVDYNSWSAHKQSLAHLKQYVASLEGFDPATLTREDEMAYWINLYNATTLRLILDAYPVDSIKDIGGLLRSPWKKDLVTVDGRSLSLNEIENDILRPRFQDPRIHFALNCAAVSCPPLAPFAFTGDKLDQQLEQVTQAAVVHPAFVSLDSSGDRVRVQLSKIFDWYAGDWEEGGGVRGFLARYRPSDRALLLDADSRLEYNDYDWKLNALVPPPR